MPYFPLGGFSPLQSDVLESVAKRLGATTTAVAQSWLLQHSPNIMLIPGTSSVAHLRENIAGAALTLPAEAVAELDAIREEQRTPTEGCHSLPVRSSPHLASAGRIMPRIVNDWIVNDGTRTRPVHRRRAGGQHKRDNLIWAETSSLLSGG